jgi:hypothetical protein
VCWDACDLPLLLLLLMCQGLLSVLQHIADLLLVAVCHVHGLDRRLV